jgi:hypothetical protein
VDFHPLFLSENLERVEIPVWEHLKEAKKTVVGWRSLCVASERLESAGSNRERDAPTTNLQPREALLLSHREYHFLTVGLP